MDIHEESERVARLVRCPACGSPVDGARCGACGIWLAGDQATELRWIDSELRRIDEAKAWLISRRAALLTDLAEISAAAASWTPASKPASTAPSAGRTERSRPELSRRTAGGLLLAAGAVLVMIAAAAFTVASWSTIGPLGRCAILLAITALMLVAPVWFQRRALNATAETVAAIGLALTIADAYLTGQLFAASELSVPSLLFALGAAAAVLAALWLAYGLAARLRIPVYAAIVAAQFPGVIATIALARAVGVSIEGPAAIALLLTSAADLLACRWSTRHAQRAMALMTSMAATATWVAAMFIAAAALLSMQASPQRALWMSAVFIAAGAIGVSLVPVSSVSWLPITPIAALSGGLLAIGLALPAADSFPAGWGPVPFALAGMAASAGWLVVGRVVGTRVADAEANRSSLTATLCGAAAGSAAIAGAAGLIEVPAALSGMFPLQQLTDVWAGPAFPPGPDVTRHVAAAVVLGLVSLTCWAAPLRRQSWLRPLAMVAAALAAGSIPAAGLTGWAALAALTLAAATLLGASCLGASRDRGSWAIAAACGGIALAVSALLWSLSWPVGTIVELAALTAMFCLVAASSSLVGRLATGCAVATATGLAWAFALASGWSVQDAAFVVLAVAVAAVAIGTLLRQVRPSHAVILDVAAGLVAPLAAVMAANDAGTFPVLAAIGALTASSVGWLRTGRRRAVVLCFAVFAVLAAIAAEARPLALALFRPYAQLAAPWHGLAQAPIPGLALATIVVGVCAVATATAAGAWRGGHLSLAVLAVALPVVTTPAGLAGGLRYWIIVGLLMALTTALTAWTAASRSLAPAGAALAAASLTLAWALAAPVPTLLVLGCLAVVYPLCGWRARRMDVRAASACLGVLSVAALAEAAALAAGSHGWQAGLAVLMVAALAHLAAGVLSSARRTGEQLTDTALLTGSKWGLQPSTAIEAGAWIAVIAGAAQCLGQPGPASAALAAAGLICIGVAARANRRPAFWIGLALGEAAWCVWLFAAGVSAPEPYTVPAAAAWLAYGWHLERRSPRPSSWFTCGPGLALLLLPSLIAVWHGAGWIRPLSLDLVAAAITLIGARLRLQAPLLFGAAVTALDAGRELASPARRLAETVPTWVPIAVTGAILLWAGATYEARLRNLSALRKTVRGMR